AAAGRAGETLDPIGEQRHRDRRRQGETGPGGKRPRNAGAHETDADADLARRRPGQELAQRDEVGVGGLLKPGTARDDLGAEIAEVGDRPAERREPELEERAQYLGPTA